MATHSEADESHRTLGVIFYGTLFVIILPFLLVVWASAAAPNVALPSIHSTAIGTIAAISGSLLLIWGIASLFVYGKGMPMNAYPPPFYVVRGAYRWLRHPIYTGFALLCIGIALFKGSASGLWLVSPIVILGCIALVLGYESMDLTERFGESLPGPILHFPAPTATAPTIAERLSVYFLVLLPWGILYEALSARGIPSDAVVAYLHFERNLPVLPWTELLYCSTYLFVLLAPLVASTGRVLRAFAIRGGVATLLMLLLFPLIPVIAPPRPFIMGGFWGMLLDVERNLDTPANAFPSYHVVWILIAMAVYARSMPRLRHLWWMLGGAISLSCVTTGMHSIADILAGFLLFLALANLRTIWEAIRRGAERVANSWKEWRWWKVRIINHGFYAGVGSFAAVTIAGMIIGDRYAGAVLLVACSALITSGLWAQFIEGSPALLRPFGYYGGVLGVAIGSFLAVPVFGTDPWLLLAAFSVAGPWVQSMGRLRCLVQGCCHGSRAPVGHGIVYRHPRSRVCRLSDLGGVPVHPTQVYSILWNVVIAAILTRLWFSHAAVSMVCGLYLILTGLGRFVEEAYRGEPQTRSFAGLRIYQWLGILSIFVGAGLTACRTRAVGEAVHVSLPILILAILFGVATWFALGVDFPGSNRRFSRLA